MSDVRIYTRAQLRQMKDQTDYEALRRTSDEEVERQSATDPDFAEFHDIDWDSVKLTFSKKQPVSIRLDEDVVGFFKAGGPGYQRRINSVLRAYMENTGAKRPKAARPKKTG